MSRQIVPREFFARLLMSFDIFFMQDRAGGVRPGAPNPLHRIEIGPGVSLRWYGGRFARRR